jgi:hypothetical protein
MRTCGAQRGERMDAESHLRICRPATRLSWPSSSIDLAALLCGGLAAAPTPGETSPRLGEWIKRWLGNPPIATGGTRGSPPPLSICLLHPWLLPQAPPRADLAVPLPLPRAELAVPRPVLATSTLLGKITLGDGSGRYFNEAAPPLFAKADGTQMAWPPHWPSQHRDSAVPPVQDDRVGEVNVGSEADPPSCRPWTEQTDTAFNFLAFGAPSPRRPAPLEHDHDRPARPSRLRPRVGRHTAPGRAHRPVDRARAVVPLRHRGRRVGRGPAGPRAGVGRAGAVRLGGLAARARRRGRLARRGPGRRRQRGRHLDHVGGRRHSPGWLTAPRAARR